VATIHPLAVVSPAAQLGRDVSIGPFCVVEPDVILGDGCRVESHVIIKSGTTLGENNYICEGAVVGGLPQHLHAPPNVGRLIVGSGNTIRERATLHRALQPDRATIVGNNNLIMIDVHIGHDVRIGNNVVLANYTQISGHAQVDDRAYVSGMVAFHQYVRVGRLAMVGAHSRLAKDVPPYVTVDGGSTLVVGLNLIGLKRAGFSHEEISQLKAAYKLIYRSGLLWSEILQRLPVEFSEGPAADFHKFFSGGCRGFTPARRVPPGATLKLVDDDELDERHVKAG
jgi:UDP-N-acetylglucosamine acyltransferase